ncbi:Aminotransferase-like [Hirschfeldia incana]|nr:Aminotransferase-like [Hirschfeldia incana]
MRKKTNLSASSSNEDLVEEREELMVSPTGNRVSLLPHIETSNTKSKKKPRKRTKLSILSSSPAVEDLVEEREELMVSPSQNRVSLPPHIQTSNTKSKKKQRKRIKLSLLSTSPAVEEDLVAEREDFMELPSGNSRPEQTHLLRPCFTTSIEGTEAPKLPRQSLKSLSLSVSFNGWRFPNVKFKSWATKMLSLHEPTWRKAGIFEAVAASAIKIIKDSELVMGVAEKWCPETKTFVFPWGEATITLEDVMLLLGFSILGSPVFAVLDSSGEKTKEKLEKERMILHKGQGRMVSQAVWMRRFMDIGDNELEHVAFLALWLSYFVFPSRHYVINEAVFPVAVHLSSGRKIALAPAVLAHLYADLTLLKDHTTRSKSIDKIELNGLFKLVQVWTWERFRELRPNNTNPLLQGELRLALWENVGQGDNDVRHILNNSKMDSFEWRPYTKTVKNWQLPKFYPEREMWVPVGPDLDEGFIFFARCIKVSELVGMDCVEHYFPNRVASQFGMLQDVPCPVNKNNLSEEEAWSEYDKPVEGLTIFIPSRSAVPRVTSVFCDWWRKSFPQLQHSLKEKCVVVESRKIIGDNCDDSSASGSRKLTRKKRVCTMGHCQAHESNEEDLNLTIAQLRRLSINKCSGGEDASEPLGKKSKFETVPPPEIEQRNEGNDETGSKTGKSMVRSPVDEYNSSDLPLGFDDATDILVSPPLETRKTCEDELDEHGSNVEKMSMTDDGNKEPDCLLHGDGSMAGEKVSSEKKQKDDSLIQKMIASNADNNEPSPCQNLVPGGSEIPGESNSGNVVGDETQGHDCLFHETVIGSKETMKSSEHNVSNEKRASGGSNGDKTSDEPKIHNAEGEGDVSNEKSKQNWKVLASSVEERIAKAQRNVAWLKERKATKLRKNAAARLI